MRRRGIPPPQELLFFLLCASLPPPPPPPPSLLAAAEPLLPAPQNLTIHSYNFKNVLRWSPVQGINGTVSYRVQHRVKSVEHWEDVDCANIMMPECDFDHIKYFYSICLHVRAEQGELKSDWIEIGPFQAKKDTILGPPRAINITAEANSILLSFLPPLDGKVKFEYLIYYGEQSAAVKQVISSQNKEHKFKNLKEMTVYCFQVQAEFEGNKGKKSESYCKKTETIEGTKIISITVTFGLIVLMLVAIFVCLLAIRKYKSTIKSLWQPPLRIPSHYEEDIQNAEMMMEDKFQSCMEDQWDTASVSSNASQSQTLTNRFTNENQVALSIVEEHG